MISGVDDEQTVAFGIENLRNHITIIWEGIGDVHGGFKFNLTFSIWFLVEFDGVILWVMKSLNLT